MIAFLVASALGYETDQLTDRDRPLADALPAANAWMDQAIAEAAERANRITGCDGDRSRDRAVLAREIATLTGRRETVPHRGVARQFGFGAYSAWLEETDTIERRDFDVRDDIFGGTTVEDSVILRFAGPCATLLLAGVLIGTDKLDHFLDTGFHYTRRADHDAALRFGTRTERTYYGLWTSKAFSFGDLAANDAGYHFYETLLEDGSVAGLDERGCIAVVRPFDWSAWVTPAWDEVLNPSVYSPRVERSITSHLTASRDRYCAAYQALGGPSYEAELAEVLAASPPYVRGRTPNRTDPFHLADLCGGH